MALIGLLAGGQVLCHLMLSGVGPGHHVGPSAAMVTAHAVAVIASALLLVSLENAARWCVASTLRVVALTAGPWPALPPRALIAATTATIEPPQVRERGVISRRGPPAGVQ